MSLKEYRRKRNFRGTPEPRGKIAKRSRGLRFVVQKHAATRLHYDLRLEMGGTYKSWAVPKGPSLNPLDQRLALKVEDHPLEYGKFEGIIPKGNYGAGTVMVWDRGTYEPRRKEKGRSDESVLLEGLEKGRLTFVLKGEKLSGEFALVRLKRAREPNAWLLLKKRDSSAVYRGGEPDDRSAATGRTMEEIRRASEGRGDVWLPSRRAARALPSGKHAVPFRETKRDSRRKRIPEKVRRSSGFSAGGGRVLPMHAVVATRPPEGEGWWYEADRRGTRVIVELEAGVARLYSRSLLPLSDKYPALRRALGAVKGEGVLDGEVAKGIFFVSDVLKWNGKDLRSLPLAERRRRLESLFKKPAAGVRLALRHRSVTEAAKGGATWVVAKRPESFYRPGISRDWVRFPARPGGAAETGPDRPPLTHLDKVYFPGDRLTKGDVVAYYERVASYILPHLKDRPQSLRRQPDGIRNEGFFQKDMTGYVPKRVVTRRIPSRSGGRTINYALCQDRWSLLYLANLGCIELNPWLSRVESLDRPDYAVIDLDPDGNSFDDVVKVALEVRRVLRRAGADAWCKTSGATGLHLYVPVGARYGYDEVRAFAEKVCRIVHARLPQITSVERSPAKRRGKIYLDFLQNRRGQTVAAAYCLRPIPGAPVSTPLRWTEVKKGLRPSRFDIRSVPARLERLGDLWAEIDKRPIDLAACLKKLEKFDRES